jgi:hypothetical protein
VAGAGPVAAAQWVIQQLRESFPDDSAPNYLVFDNDTRY